MRDVFEKWSEDYPLLSQAIDVRLFTAGPKCPARADVFAGVARETLPTASAATEKETR